MTAPTPGQPLSEADVSPCTDCDGTGITTQSERPCSCSAGDAYRPHAPVSRPGDGVEWPAVTNVWAETYCELTGKDPDGQQVTFVDGGTVTTFRDMAKREIEAMLCAAPKAAVRAISALTPPAEPVSRPAGGGEREAVAILKGIGKIDGDGWKDTTTKGEVVYVWNAEKPSPYAPGQYPRIGNEGWSASTSQYDFTPATADDVPAILALIRPAAPGGGDAEFEVRKGGELVASTYGPRDRAYAEAQHYAAVYGQDGPVQVFEIIRRRVPELTTAIPASEGG